MNEDRLINHLDQMCSAARQAHDFTAGMTLDTFLADIRTQMAVAMALVLIGESAVRIMARYPHFSTDHPDIPWTKMKGMRNFVVHDYYRLELPTVWDTVQTAIPDLLDKLETLRNFHAQGE